MDDIKKTDELSETQLDDSQLESANGAGFGWNLQRGEILCPKCKVTMRQTGGNSLVRIYTCPKCHGTQAVPV